MALSSPSKGGCHPLRHSLYVQGMHTMERQQHGMVLLCLHQSSSSVFMMSPHRTPYLQQSAHSIGIIATATHQPTPLLQMPCGTAGCRQVQKCGIQNPLIITIVQMHALGSQVVCADGATAAVGVQLRREARLLDLVQHRREQRPRCLHRVVV
jgi:hypothetical protein